MLTQKEKNDKIINELKENNLNYTLIGNIINKQTKTSFLCNNCKHIFEATPHNIIYNKRGCPKCGSKHRWDYSEVVNYINNTDNQEYILISSEDDLKTDKSKSKISTNNYAIIYHKKCQKEFKIRLSHFLKDGLRCSNCISNKKYSDEKFQEKLDNIYGGLFTLIKGTYNGRHNNVQCRCEQCKAIINDKAFNFITNHRNCSYCTAPISERIILNNFNKEILTQYIPKRDDNRKLKYDFFYNGLILECDGIQHFKSVKYFGGEESFKKQLERDYLKNKYALDNHLYLIRVLDNEIINKSVNIIFNNSTTIKELEKEFNSILVIKNGKVLLQKGKYLGLSSCTFK